VDEERRGAGTIVSARRSRTIFSEDDDEEDGDDDSGVCCCSGLSDCVDDIVLQRRVRNKMWKRVEERERIFSKQDPQNQRKQEQEQRGEIMVIKRTIQCSSVCCV
jgi:hypothetical protein